ncbi:MAG: TRAP transporter large permease subunit [Eubacteriaceae bacterium]|jgi:TRAP-type C4-dicarboxylate transport system permease large subunit|nr:TRAP transporter large permease subunit [Eubacteriaceae bacterium]
MIPLELLWMLLLLAIIVLSFIIFKRPIYESMLTGFLVLAVVMGQGKAIPALLLKPSTNTLFYAIVAFLTLAFVFGETQVVNTIITFMMSLVGRFRGGAGYVSLTSSAFMSALSGTGPGNVAATGVFTIPTMMKTGFSPELAATTEMSASSLGPMIPPSGTILLAFGVLDATMPDTFNLSTFWLVVWGIGLWFVAQRLLLLFILCRVEKVKAIPVADISSFKKTVKEGWKALLVPFIIFLPLLLDFLLKDTFFTARIGAEGAGALFSSVIQFTPGVAALYTLWISRNQLEGGLRPRAIVNLFKKGVKSVVPVAATIYFAYCISELFGQANVGQALEHTISSFNLSGWQVAIVVPLFTMFLGMFLPGSSQIAIFGVGIVGVLIAVDVPPLLAAGILPAITGALEGMTPPLALCMYTAMGISGSGMKETSRLALIWVFAHLTVAVLILLGIVPVPFL